jgi:hypothetical protein
LKNDYFNMNKEVLMNERGNYFRIARDQWQDFYTPNIMRIPVNFK